MNTHSLFLPQPCLTSTGSFIGSQIFYHSGLCSNPVTCPLSSLKPPPSRHNPSKTHLQSTLQLTSKYHNSHQCTDLTRPDTINCKLALSFSMPPQSPDSKTDPCASSLQRFSGGYILTHCRPVPSPLRFRRYKTAEYRKHPLLLQPYSNSSTYSLLSVSGYRYLVIWIPYPS